MPLPDSEDDEVSIVTTRIADLSSSLELPKVPTAEEEIRRVRHGVPGTAIRRYR